jgi:hypothetical protein
VFPHFVNEEEGLYRAGSRSKASLLFLSLAALLSEQKLGQNTTLYQERACTVNGIILCHSPVQQAIAQYSS